MATDTDSPQREPTPSGTSFPTSIPQKRALEDDHSPAVSSPLNPEVKSTQRVQIQMPEEGQGPMAREKRTKKDSLKKRESKATAGSVADTNPRATPDRKLQKEAAPGEVAPLRYKLAPPKPSDFEQSRGPVFTSHHEVQDPDGRTIDFLETSEHVYNKKNFHYTHCIADPAFPSMFYYRQTEPEPYRPHMSFEDTASHVLFDKSGTHVTSNKGFRMARANVAVREGRWYWECKVTQGILKQRGEGDPESHGHVRVGWARREASLDAPVGFDAYSYGIRDVAGQKVHMSRPKDFFPAGESFQEGDVIGLEIQLPSERLHRKVVQGQYNPAVDLADEDNEPGPEAPNIVRDRIPIRFKAHIYFERIDYHTTKELEELMNPSPMSSSGTGGSSAQPNPHHPLPPLRTLPNSHIKVYKNGVLMGTPFTDLLAFLPPASKMVQQPAGRDSLDDGSLGYYPAVSIFRGGAAEVNFGPDFWYPPPGLGEAKEGGEDVEMTDSGAPEAPPQAEPQLQLGGASHKLRPVSDRYAEQIVEDIVYDVIDEVSFWVEDGRKVVDRSGKDDKVGETPVPGGREEIKELVQDD
ncbi:concanavalin A-like lectin/glucanase domain-containing protein [Cercophora newfieldiana]|uniref:Concanavalin A-like lectin/glucanase domain-containing protein n=1 Tax=Cercophora newfieldiana TaxID=92897 RepID=A0AA39Y1Z5_9PEZI|nr:concanavalin A-like lectin/glucanase domain-containing protein [Cercophora newfieldiana]